MGGLSDDTKRLLMQASTATLTTQLFKRGLRNTFVQGVVAADAGRAGHGRRGLYAAHDSGARGS